MTNVIKSVLFGVLALIVLINLPELFMSEIHRIGLLPAAFAALLLTGVVVSAFVGDSVAQSTVISLVLVFCFMAVVIVVLLKYGNGAALAVFISGIIAISLIEKYIIRSAKRED